MELNNDLPTVSPRRPGRWRRLKTAVTLIASISMVAAACQQQSTQPQQTAQQLMAQPPPAAQRLMAQRQQALPEGRAMVALGCQTCTDETDAYYARMASDLEFPGRRPPANMNVL